VRYLHGQKCKEGRLASMANSYKAVTEVARKNVKEYLKIS